MAADRLFYERQASLSPLQLHSTIYLQLSMEYVSHISRLYLLLIFWQRTWNQRNVVCCCVFQLLSHREREETGRKTDRGEYRHESATARRPLRWIGTKKEIQQRMQKNLGKGKGRGGTRSKQRRSGMRFFGTPPPFFFSLSPTPPRDYILWLFWRVHKRKLENERKERVKKPSSSLAYPSQQLHSNTHY